MTLRDRNNDQQKIGEDKNRKNQIKKRSSQRLSNYSQSSQNQKSSQRTLISKRQSSDTNNSKRLDDKNYDLSKTIQVNNGYKNKLEYYSRTETETEQEDDENSEDEKFEKKLSKSLKSETPITKQTQALASSINTNQNDDLSQSSLHHSKRPKRQGTQNGRYYGFETFQQRHDHSHYQLISYQNYKSQSAQPYIIYISLDEYEVIGFLGGYCYENQFSPQKLIPCDSLIESQVERQKNVDLCPISANNARQIIQSRGQQVLGWYHSHPFFPVEPSLIDIRNHAVYQKNFDLANLPFIALIIGPYSTKNKNESLCKVFHLVKEKQPFSLNFKQLPNKKMRKALINEIKDILMKYKAHQDKINLKEKWCAGYTREEKLVEAIEIILEKNLKQKDKNDVQHELSTNLSSSDYQSYSQKGLFTLSTTHSEGSYSKRSDIEYTNPNSNMLDCSIINQESLEQQNLNNSNNSNAANIIVATVSNNLDQYDSNGTLLLQNLKKESYFSIENEDRVEKFMNKLKSMIGKILFQDDSSQSQNKADNCLKQERKQQFKPEQITLSS
ncbi:histone h2a deubiquitinase mysm1 [Stylonychia lemnae]|uniref:Histone h2a deubiquitinase mysm1 n=1 Tax=Stylonychia lemnae TaxID=5949 RepID=A0A078AXT8_STYLE|nr:histone h2a deubiquitinase mysm1 [Stylonychia lemnae]|eukprot:CDW86052.1 histone h2a deubiquitinase mysm1 [Stylonychia lemnae]